MNRFLYKIYDPVHYHCGHFACDVMEHLTSAKLADILRSVLLPLGSIKLDYSLRRMFVREACPQGTALIIMSRPKFSTHMGVRYDNSIYHLTPTGAKVQTLYIATYGYTKVRLYTCQTK